MNRPTSIQQPQQLYFRKICKTNGFNIILRERGGRTNPTSTQRAFFKRENPIGFARPVWGMLHFAKCPKFYWFNRAVITTSKNDPFWDLKTDSGSSRRALAFSGRKTRLGAQKSHFFENLYATLDLQVLVFPPNPKKNSANPRLNHKI